MPRRPRTDKEPTLRGSATAVTPETCEPTPERDRPDFDARERNQSPTRKAAGPDTPQRTAPLSSSDDDDDADDLPLESWGSSPRTMPPVDPS